MPYVRRIRRALRSARSVKRRTFTRRRPLARKTFRKRPRAVSAVGVKRIAQRVVKRNLEKKAKTYAIMSGKNVRGGGLSLTGALTHEYGAIIANLPFLMATTQGTNSQQRLGNHLNNSRAFIKGFLRSADYNSVTNNNTSPFEIVMVIYRKKDDYTNNDPNALKDSKVNSYVAIDGSIQNDMLPWNKDGYTIYKTRRWRLKPQPAPLVRDLPDSTITNHHTELFSVNPERGSSLNPMMVRFRQRLPIPKTLKYNENAPYTVNNSSFALGFYILNCDGSTVPTDQYRAQIWADMQLSWTD